jgi:hypothetical protein
MFDDDIVYADKYSMTPFVYMDECLIAAVFLPYLFSIFIRRLPIAKPFFTSPKIVRISESKNSNEAVIFICPKLK